MPTIPEPKPIVDREIRKIAPLPSAGQVRVVVIDDAGEYVAPDDMPTTRPVDGGWWLDSGALRYSEPLPEMTVTVNNSNPQDGASITFTATAGYPSYTWKRNGVTIAGQTASTLNFTVDWVNHLDEFTAEYDGSVSDPVVITVDAEPTLTTWDYYLSPSGNDSNAGTSAGAAWRSFPRLAAYILTLDGGAGGQTIRVKIATGTYTGGFNPPNLTVSNAVSVYLDFDANCILQRDYNISADNGVEAADKVNIWVYGNAAGKLRLQNFGRAIDGTATDGDGLGSGLSGQLRAWNVIVESGDDNWSHHATGYGKVVDCEFSNNRKSCYAHIGSSTGLAARCTFTGYAGAVIGIGRLDDTTVFDFYDCTFTPATNGQTCGFNRSTLHRCKIGTLTKFVNMEAGNSDSNVRPSLYDCFIYSRQTHQGTGGRLTRCYGNYMNNANGANSTSPLIVEHCVWRRFASDDSIAPSVAPFWEWNGIPYSNFNAGSCAPIIIRDCIFTQFYQSIAADFGGWGTQMKSDFNNFSLVQNNWLFNNTYGMWDWVTCDTGTIISSTGGSNPGLGPMNSLNQADWAVSSSGPCVGAGVTGGNIGFTLADIPS